VASIFAAHLADDSFEQSEGDPKQHQGSSSAEMLSNLLWSAAHESLNPRRALMLTTRIASSLDKARGEIRFSRAHLEKLVGLCGASEFFGEMIASNPGLILALPLDEAEAEKRDYRLILKRVVESEDSFGAEMAALRREWAKLIVEIGSLDACDSISMFEANARQTALAAASLDAGCLIASRELNRRSGRQAGAGRLARVAILGLGRLGGGGMDYGSDLDVVLVYDDAAQSPVETLLPAEAFARFSEFLVAALSSVTRDGYLYRVDLRLRPDGKNGRTCSGARAFTDYLKERAVEWEWLAYVKLRAAAGDLQLGRRVEAKAREIIHEAARSADAETLRLETRRVRERLEHEKMARRAKTTDIKYGAGGMLDVYFATRFLQLRDNVPDDTQDRSTRVVLERLHASGSLDEDDYKKMKAGYALLRALDHHLRLIVGRSTRLPPADHPTLRDIANKLDYDSAEEMAGSLSMHMQSIRAAYDRITNGKQRSGVRIQKPE
jgi:glutamate-ammonia-ligase adenylyltransferase